MDLDALAERDRARRLRQLKNAKRQAVFLLLCVVAGLAYIFVKYVQAPRGKVPDLRDVPTAVEPKATDALQAPEKEKTEPPPTPPEPLPEQKEPPPPAVDTSKTTGETGTIRQMPASVSKLIGDKKPSVPVANVLASIGVTDSEKSKRELPKVTEAKRVLELLARAKDVPSKVEYVVIKPGIEDRMKIFYESGGSEPASGERVADFAVTSAGERYLEVVYQNPARPNGRLRACFIRDEKGIVRVDWESLVGYSTMSIQDLRARKPEEPVTMRVFATVDDYHNYEFTDAKKYLSVRLRNAVGTDAVNGFCEIGGRVATALNVRLSVEAAADAAAAKDDPAAAPKRTWAPVIVKVRFPTKPQSDHCVELIDLLNGQWLAPAGLVE